jgi:hypothetical protein
MYRNGQKAGSIPRPLQMHSTKISGLAVDTEYTFHLVLKTTAGTRMSEKMTVRTHKMTDLSGVTITTGILPGAIKEHLGKAVERIGAKIVDGVRIDTTHFVTTEGRGTAWEKAVENNIPVVRPEWVDACEKNGRILGVTKFYLDAMRPGPPSDETISPPPVPVKDELPVRAAEPSRAAQGTTNGDRASEAQGEASKEDEREQEAELEEPEQKAKTPSHPDEQKMRLEDMEEQKVALHRSTSNIESEGVEQEAGDEEGTEEEQAEGKPAGTPDGASFQEVEL